MVVAHVDAIVKFLNWRTSIKVYFTTSKFNPQSANTKTHRENAHHSVKTSLAFDCVRKKNACAYHFAIGHFIKVNVLYARFNSRVESVKDIFRMLPETEKKKRETNQPIDHHKLHKNAINVQCLNWFDLDSLLFSEYFLSVFLPVWFVRSCDFTSQTVKIYKHQKKHLN